MNAAQILAKVSTVTLTYAQKFVLVKKYALVKATYNNIASIQARSAFQGTIICYKITVSGLYQVFLNMVLKVLHYIYLYQKVILWTC